jgi:hypothetical protein
MPRSKVALKYCHAFVTKFWFFQTDRRGLKLKSRFECAVSKSTTMKISKLSIALCFFAYFGLVHSRVVIIGAGISGVAAGRRLWDAGITDFVVLESRDLVGGRMTTVPFGGLNLQRGAGESESCFVLVCHWRVGQAPAASGSESHPFTLAKIPLFSPRKFGVVRLSS